MVLIFSFRSYSTQHDAHFVNDGPFRVKSTTETPLELLLFIIILLLVKEMQFIDLKIPKQLHEPVDGYGHHLPISGGIPLYVHWHRCQQRICVSLKAAIILHCIYLL